MTEVSTQRDGPVLVATINRPEARNAVDQAVAQQIAAWVDELDSDQELRVGVLTGGGGTFSAGMDLKAFLKGQTPYIEERGFAGIAQARPKKPVVAAVEGYALAGGFELALACDLIVAARTAAFGIPEVKRGLVAAAGGLIRLPRRISYHLAMELALTGEMIGAERAYEIGIVNRLADHEGALETALQLARTVAANGPLAVEASKQMIMQAPELGEDEAWQVQGELAGPVLVSEDAREGAAAFAERRAPNWQGR